MSDDVEAKSAYALLLGLKSDRFRNVQWENVFESELCVYRFLDVKTIELRLSDHEFDICGADGDVITTFTFGDEKSTEVAYEDFVTLWDRALVKK